MENINNFIKHIHQINYLHHHLRKLTSCRKKMFLIRYWNRKNMNIEYT